MDIKPIKTDQDYEMTLGRIEALMNAEPGTPEFDELDILATLVEAYEAKHFPVDPPPPIEAIRFRMEQEGLLDKDLIPFIGSSGRVSEVMNYQRRLTLPMIRKLNAGLRIPLESLIQPYELRTP